MDKNGILRVKHEEDLPDIEVDSITIPIASLTSGVQKITSDIVNTGSASRLKCYREPVRDIEDMKAIATLLGEDWYIAPPLDFYHYELASFEKNQKVTTGLRCTLTPEGGKWIVENDTFFPVPKPLTALHGIPVISYEKIFHPLGTISNSMFSHWDAHQILKATTRKWSGRSSNKRFRASSSVMKGGGRNSLSGDMD